MHIRHSLNKAAAECSWQCNKIIVISEHKMGEYNTSYSVSPLSPHLSPVFVK